MRQLSGIDAAFLQMETTTTYAHVASVSVYEPPPGRPPLGLDELRRHVAARIHRAPVLRQRLLELPLELGRPYWVDDPDFDLDRHVRGADLEGPVDDERLAAYVSRMVGRRLDRSRPLWELQLIPGLAGGRFALLGIVHHAAVDGIAGRDVLATLLDRDPEPAEDPAPPPWRPEPLPSRPGVLLRDLAGLASQPLRVLELQQRAAKQLAGRLRDAGRLPQLGEAFDPARWWPAAAASGPAGGPGTAPVPAPRAPFNRPITGRRAWTPLSLPRERLRAVRKAYGVGGNDVLLALCAGALRRWLLAHGGVPARPLRAMVPISVRARSGDASAPPAGNQVSFMLTDLPTQEPDPVRRLRSIAGTARESKTGHDALGVAEGLAGVADLVVPALATATARAAAQLRVADWVEPAFNLVVSSVPGPQVPLHLRGARLLHAYPVSVVTDGLGLNITVQSTGSGLDVGLTACPELVPGLADLARALELSLDELEAAGPR